MLQLLAVRINGPNQQTNYKKKQKNTGITRPFQITQHLCLMSVPLHPSFNSSTTTTQGGASHCLKTQELGNQHTSLQNSHNLHVALLSVIAIQHIKNAIKLSHPYRCQQLSNNFLPPWVGLTDVQRAGLAFRWCVLWLIYFYFFQGCNGTGDCIIKSFCVLYRPPDISLCVAVISLSVAYSLKLVHRQPIIAYYV